MNNIKKTLVFAAASYVATFAMATPVVSNVTMTQDTGRMVTITYSLSEDSVVTLNVLTNATPNAATGWVSIGGAAICNAQGDVWKKVSQGSKTITWRPDQSWKDEFGNGFKVEDGCAKAVVTAWSLDNTPNYMVVDVSDAAQPNTQRYYPAADFVPGGVSNGLYKTTTLLMRKIMAKDVVWTMGSTTLETQRNPDQGSANREATHQVALTNNYYIGVYQVTQAQWALIQPSRPEPAAWNNAADRAMRPVEQVCYNEIRLRADNETATSEQIDSYSWPKGPNPDSFLGKLRTRSGLDFDLPSEAQWEFAARAGNGDTKWGDGSGILNNNKDANLNLLGRYELNGGKVWNGSSHVEPTDKSLYGPTNGTAIVGSYAPNAWGLYDTAGNLWEWCHDWYEQDISAYGGAVNIDPSAPAQPRSGNSATIRVCRGGSWRNAASWSRPAYRGVSQPDNRSSYIGFRVLCTAGLQ